MAVEQAVHMAPERPLVSPWPVALGGLGVVVVGGLAVAASPAAAPAGALVLLAGLAVMGVAAASLLPALDRDPSNRWTLGGLLGLLFLAGGMARITLGLAWDSFAILFDLLMLASAAGAGALVLPPWLARAGVVGLVVLHLGGLLTAVVLVPPPNGPPPWLAAQAYVRFYRPWLQLVHLNNGYHFYAPEPGPVILLRFRVQYADGAAVWVRLPDHDAIRSGLELRRQGALANSLATPAPQGPDFPERFARLTRQREEAGAKHRPPIPLVLEVPVASQYRELAPQSLLLLSSYVKRVAQTTPHPEDARVPIRSIKAYRLDYTNATPAQFRDRIDPYDPILYQAFYLGEYAPDGTLSPASLQVDVEQKTGKVDRKQDGFLYWQLPIVRIQRPDGTWRLVNGLRIHAGEGEEDDIP